MSNLVIEIKALEIRKAEVDKKLKIAKLESDYDQILKSLRDAKAELYNFMLDNDMDEFEGYESSKLMPDKEKKELRKSIKATKISELLQSSFDIDTDDVNSISDKLADLK